MAVTIAPSDLEPFIPGLDTVRAQAMVDDCLAMAYRVAPCLATSEFIDDGAGKAILRQALLRWYESGNGAVQSQTAGPFTQMLDTRQPRRGMFWPSEIKSLQELCGAQRAAGGAFEIDTAPPASGYTWLTPDTWVPLP